MPARQSIATTATCNKVGEDPRELEARADEHDARAYDLDAAAAQERAEAQRLRANAKRCTVTAAAPAAVHLTRREYALRASVSEATVTRWLAEGMPTIPVGSTVRIDPVAADDWRRARGRVPTKAKAKVPDVDVDVDLGRAGLRVVGGCK